MKKITALLVFFYVILSAYSQPGGFAKEVFDLINLARTSPQKFLTLYKNDIESCSPQFTKILQNATPVQAVIWDNGLAGMAKEIVVNNNLNPSYPGNMDDFCFSSGGSGSSSGGYSAIEMLCDFYTIINDESETHFGIYSNGTSYAFEWGRSCGGQSMKHPFTYTQTADTSTVDFNKLNTAKNVSYLSHFEKEMVKEINFARHYPAIYAHMVGQHMAQMASDWGGISKDDIFATNELLEELKNMKPLSILEPKECLYTSSKIHGEDCKKRGFSGHTGTDGSSPFARIEKYCDGAEGSENIVGTSDHNVRKSVISLLVDSGISSRGHRYNMLNPEWNFVGCYHYIEENHEYAAYFTMGYCIQNFSK